MSGRPVSRTAARFAHSGRTKGYHNDKWQPIVRNCCGTAAIIVVAQRHRQRCGRLAAQRGSNVALVDVLVIGGGNAALCAALMAREAGATVLLLEASPREWRGGNSQHTRNLRCMHDAPQDVLVDAYPEEEFWQDLLKVTGGMTDEKLARLVIRASSTCRAVDGRGTACASSRRCPVRCTSRARTRSSWAAARRWSTPITAAPRRWACRSATTRRWTRSSSDGRASSRPGAARRALRGPGLRARGRRLRVEPRVAARSMGPQRARRVAGGQLPDPRHALQQRRGAALHARRGCRRSRRSVTVALRGDRRARTALRRRHLHPHRLRVAGRRRQPRRASASTTRARTSGPSATRSGAAWSRSSRGRSATRSSMPRRSGASCRRCSRA